MLGEKPGAAPALEPSEGPQDPEDMLDLQLLPSRATKNFISVV